MSIDAWEYDRRYSSFEFRHSFGFRDSSFGLGNCGSWKACSGLRPCIGTMNPKRAGRCRRQGAADVSSAELFSDSPAGKMPAAPWRSWKAHFRFCTRIGTMNCPADVAQASWPASSPGASPGVRAGGETPPQLAAGTAALRGSWRKPHRVLLQTSPGEPALMARGARRRYRNIPLRTTVCRLR